MDLRALKRRCEARARDLDVPAPFDVRVFCDLLAKRRGRPIELRPIATGSGPCGLWIASDSADYIFYELDTSPLHQEHIILHEVSHLICDHQAALANQSDLLKALLPDISPETVRLMLSRNTYSREEEREAEMLASVLLERISSRRPRGTPVGLALDPAEVEVLDRLVVALRADPEEA
jgi:hypothetical protein